MYQHTTLANGLRIVTAAMPHTRSATVSMYVGAGSRYESDEEAGLSHFLEHMLFKGASRRPTARDISEAIERAGGGHNAATDRELTVYYAKVPDIVADEAIDILADMVRAPVMDPVELEKERMVILEELAMVEDNPPELAGILIDEVMWPGQPIGRNIGGSPQTVRTLPIEAVNAYMQAQYQPSNMVLAVAGNIEHERVVATVERWLGDMPDRPAGPWHPAVARNGSPRLAVKQKPTEQAHICIAYPSVSLMDPDRFAVDLLSAVLGEGMSSRLFLQLREEMALVYDVHSYPSEFRDTGAFTVYAGCDPTNARQAAEAIFGEIEGLLRELPDEEFAKGKQMAKGRMLLRMEDTRSVAGWIGAQLLLLDRVETVEEVTARVEAVTLDDVRRVGRELFRQDVVTIAAVGPFEDDGVFAGLI